MTITIEELPNVCFTTSYYISDNMKHIIVENFYLFICYCGCICPKVIYFCLFLTVSVHFCPYGDFCFVVKGNSLFETRKQFDLVVEFVGLDNTRHKQMLEWCRISSTER